MTKPLAIALVLAALFLAGEATSSAADGVALGGSTGALSLSATMTARQVVTPKNKPWKPPASVAKAHGTFVGTLISGKRSLKWRITYASIGASTLNIADIHLGKPGRFGQVLARLCGPCKSGQSGTKKISALASQSIRSGNSWITVITSKYPNGVIRGQIKAR